jgi:hypothetical protein
VNTAVIIIIAYDPCDDVEISSRRIWNVSWFQLKRSFAHEQQLLAEAKTVHSLFFVYVYVYYTESMNTCMMYH